MSHLDDLTLEKVLLDAAPAAAEHLAACADCSARLARMRSEDADFRQYVFPATVDAVVAAKARPARGTWWSVLPAAAFAGAALAVVLLAVPPAGPPPDYVGDKGQSLGLAVYTLDPSGAAVQLADGARVPATAVLRFQVAPKAPCYLWLVSIDARGQVSRLYPEKGEAAYVAGRSALPGGATLDGVPGPERLFGVCSPAALPFSAVEAAARTGGTAEAVRRLRELALSGAVQGTLLLEKQP